MPTQNRIGRHDAREFLEEFVPQRLPFDRQPPPLVIIQQNALLASFFAKNLVLGSEILDDLLLLPIDPIRQNDEQQLPRLQNEIHRGTQLSNCEKSRMTGGVNRTIDSTSVDRMSDATFTLARSS